MFKRMGLLANGITGNNATKTPAPTAPTTTTKIPANTATVKTVPAPAPTPATVQNNGAIAVGIIQNTVSTNHASREDNSPPLSVNSFDNRLSDHHDTNGNTSIVPGETQRDEELALNLVNDACVALTLTSDIMMAACWSERLASVKSFSISKSKRLIGAVGVMKGVEEMVLGREALNLPDDADIVYPLAFLADIPHRKHQYLKMTEKGRVKLPKSSKEFDPSILLGKIIGRIHDAASQAYASEVSKDKRKRPSLLRLQKITLVVPSFSPPSYREKMIKVLTSANIPLRNVFGNAEAVVVGLLYRSAVPNKYGTTTLLHDLANVSGENNSNVLYVQVNQGHIDTAVVVCEGSIMQNFTGNRMRVKRVCTEASSSGEFLAGSEFPNDIVQRTVRHITAVLESKGISSDAIAAVVWEGLKEPVMRALDICRARGPFYEPIEADASHGACILTAGEVPFKPVKERRSSIRSTESMEAEEMPVEEKEPLNGYATIFYPDDDPFGRKSYEGYFVKGLFDGHGELTFKSGAKYIGEFNDDERHGMGAYYYSNGDRYEGGWKHNKREGWGCYKCGRDTYEGEWKNNMAEGRGVYYYGDGRRYYGIYKEDGKDGRGVMYQQDGTVLDQLYEDGELVESNSRKYVDYN